MPNRPHTRLAILSELCLDAVLFLSLITQVFLLGTLLVHGNLPLPRQVLDHKLTAMLPPGLSISSDSYSVSTKGTLHIKNLQLSLDDRSQAPFVAESAHVEMGWKKDWHSPLRLKKLVVAGGSLILPAVHSPNGRDNLILDRIAFRLLPAEHALLFDTFAARHEDIRVRGRIEWSLPHEPSQRIDLPKTVDGLFRQITFLAKQKSQIKGLSRPTILFNLKRGEDQLIDISSRISSQYFQHADFKVNHLILDADLTLHNQTLIHNSSLYFKADQLQVEKYNMAAKQISVLADQGDWQALIKGEWPRMQVASADLRMGDIFLDSTYVRLNPESDSEMTIQGSVRGLGSVVEVAGKIDLSERSGVLHSTGNLDLLALASTAIKTRLPNIRFHDTPNFDLSLRFDQDFTLSGADLRARVDRFEVGGILFDHLQMEGAYTDGIYLIENLYTRRGWQWLDMGFRINPASQDYMLTLQGFAKPNDYNPILPRWWGRIFQEFDFEQMESGLGDFVLYGKTNARAVDFFFGHVRAGKVAYRGVLIDEGELFVRGRGPFAEIHQLDLERAEGYVRGNIAFASRLDAVPGPMSVRLDLESKLPLSEATKLFDAKVAAILSDFETETIPTTTLRGVLFNPAYPEYNGYSHLQIRANCPAPLSYKGIPLDYLDFDLHAGQALTCLRNVLLGYAGGTVTAEADILNNNQSPPEARLKLSLKGADQNLAVNQFSALRQTSELESIREPTPGKGRLDFDLHARGLIDDPLAMSGNGHLRIENQSLYAIQLLGPLSRLLEKTQMGFTSFELNQLQAAFFLRNGFATFEQLQINGPRTRIEAPGILNLRDLSLAMRVSVFLFGNMVNLESNLGRIGELMTKPLPNLLEFELSGTIEAQKWRSLYDPRNFIPLF